MSAEFYFSRGYTPRCWSHMVAGGNTATIVDPGVGKRVVLTNISISSVIGGTIAFYFGGRTLASNTPIAQYVRQGSTTINPSITAWESTAFGSCLFAVLTGTSTDGCYINAEGFITD